MLICPGLLREIRIPGQILNSVPLIFPENVVERGGGGGGVCLKKFSEHFQKFQKIFPDKDQLNFFGPIPVKLIGLKNFLMPVFILFILFFNNKNVPNIFFNYTFYGPPFGTFFNSGSPKQISPFASPEYV
jgi:hypothetical protein